MDDAERLLLAQAREAVTPGGADER
jgi:hypothetical protein